MQQKHLMPLQRVHYFPIALLTIIFLFLGGYPQMHSSFSDVARWHCYALAFWQGKAPLLQPENKKACSFLIHDAYFQPFHTIPFEYPILAIIPFSLTLLPGLWYQYSFALGIGAFILFLFWYLKNNGPPFAIIAFTIYLFLGAFGTALARFDIIPAGLTLFCLTAADRKQFKKAYIFLAISVMLKLYSLPLVLLLFLAEQQFLHKNKYAKHLNFLIVISRIKGIGIFFIVCLLLFVFSFLLNPHHALSPLQFFSHRPFQIESIPASILWFSSLIGNKICLGFDFGSVNLYEQMYAHCSLSMQQSGLLTHLLSFALPLIFVIGLFVVLLLQYQKKITLRESFLVTLLLILLTSKVLSPQFFTWVIPIIAYMYATSLPIFSFWSAILGITSFIYPIFYSLIYTTSNKHFLFLFFLIIALRNLGLLVFTGGYITVLSKRKVKNK